MRALYSALVLSLAAFTPALADEVRPDAAYTVALGDLHGVAYYTVADDGYHLVATFAGEGSADPVRVSAVLAPRQRLSVSVPSALGATSEAVDFVHDGDRIVVAHGEIASN